MPTYEYECSKGCHFEVKQSMKDDALKRCTKALCPRGEGGVPVERLISAANFILKGGGWYSDGYSSSGGKSDSSESSPDSSSKSSSSGSSTSSSGDSSSGSSSDKSSGGSSDS